jgi:2-oxoglutarate ferredoxin oxidoreductase subunit alpha
MVPNPTLNEKDAMKEIINDFNLTVSTINGSGSATANSTLLRALFRMGIPVSGKNNFPSNIQGQPTWFTIRVNQNGYLGRQEKDDIVIAMKPGYDTKGNRSSLPGRSAFYADHIHLPVERTDITVYPMPVKKIMHESEVNPSVREYVANMIYVGIAGELLGIDMDQVYKAIDYHFKGKETAIKPNWSIVKTSAEWARENLEKKDPYKVKSLPALTGSIMVDGNTAAALGAIYGGVQLNAWYPTRLQPPYLKR